jgi:ribosome-associated protein
VKGETTLLNANELVAVAVKALDSKKGKNISVLHTADQTTLADYFVICAGTSNTQVNALADAVEEAMDKAGEQPHHVEGHRGGQWTLLDYSAVVVHVFTEEAREFYALERLWSDAAPVDISAYLTEN